MQTEKDPFISAEKFTTLLTWIEEITNRVDGRPLNDLEKEWALKAGIDSPEYVDLIRIAIVNRMPKVPVSLQELSKQYLNLEKATGLTLGAMILILNGHESDRLIRHELRHVAQCYEDNGLVPFITKYIEQLLKYGYEHAPYELDARYFEHADI